MSAVLLRATGRCRVLAFGPLRLVGTGADGEAKTVRPSVVHAPGTWFLTPRRIADALTIQKLAAEDVPPDHLRRLIAAVIDAPTAREAAAAALKASIPVLVASDGLAPWKPIGSPEAAACVFGAEPAPEPVFAVEQTVAAGRLRRLYAWRAGAIIEVPAS